MWLPGGERGVFGDLPGGPLATIVGPRLMSSKGFLLRLAARFRPVDEKSCPNLGSGGAKSQLAPDGPFDAGQICWHATPAGRLRRTSADYNGNGQ